MKTKAEKLGPTETEIRQEARQQALKRLAKREHSEKELEGFLQRREVPADIISDTIEKLVAEKLVDDQRYARALIHSQVLRERGPGYILQKLELKGVKIELSEVRKIFSETSDCDEFEMARHVVERRYPLAMEDEKIRRRAYAALLRRGFSDDTARKALL